MQQNNMPNIAKDYKIKNIVFSVFAVISGIVLSIALWTWTAVAFGLMIAIFFMFRYFEFKYEEKIGDVKYIHGVVVSDDTRKNILKQDIAVYRIVPVTADGTFIDENGAHDIYLEMPGNKKKWVNNIYVGATYDFLFRTGEEGDMSARNLITYSRDKRLAKDVSVTVQEEPTESADEEVEVDTGKSIVFQPTESED